MADAEELHNQGIAAFRIGDTATAISCLEQAAELDGSRADYKMNLAVILHLSGDLESSEEHFRGALTIDPGDASIHYNYGLLLGDMDKLIEALAHYDIVVELDEANGAAHNNRGNILKRLQRYAEAMEAYTRAITADPDFAPAYKNLADAQESLGHVKEARSNYAQAIGLRNDPGSRIRDALLLPVIAESEDQILEYRHRMNEKLDRLIADDLDLSDPLAEVGATNFALAYHGLDDRSIQEKLAGFYRQACPSLGFEAAHCEETGSRNQPIKIGFVSAFFHEHTIAKLNHQLIAGLPRSKFEVLLFSLSDQQDAWSGKLGQAADKVVQLPKNLATAREQIASARLDILYYTDIGMEPMTYFLSFARLAPIQSVTWGHPVTTGLSTIDYFISSELTEPAGAENQYSEKLVRLASMTTSVAPPLYEGERTRGEWSGGQLVVCPQSLFKYHPDFDLILNRILADNAGMNIMIIRGSLDAWSDHLMDRFKRTMPDNFDRVGLLPRLDREAYADLMAAADIVLDTPHFCGGMTTYEALATDTPVVTLPSEFMRGRLSLGLYRQMGVMDCVASDAEAYCDIVSRLSQDERFRKDVVEKIHDTKEKIFSDRNAIDQHVEFFEQAMSKL